MSAFTNALLAITLAASGAEPPRTPEIPVVDDYFGTKVRWD